MQRLGIFYSHFTPPTGLKQNPSQGKHRTVFVDFQSFFFWHVQHKLEEKPADLAWESVGQLNNFQLNLPGQKTWENCRIYKKSFQSRNGPNQLHFAAYYWSTRNNTKSYQVCDLNLLFRFLLFQVLPKISLKNIYF